MEDTCIREKCPLWKKFKGRCPNFIETGWKEHDKAQPIMVADCAPKRTLLMMQTLYNRFIGVQKSNEKQVNTNVQFMGVLESVFEKLQLMGPGGPAVDVIPEEIEDKTA